MDGILTPAQRRALEQAANRCNRCRPKLDYLRAMGVPAEEEEERVQHLYDLTQRGLAADDAARQAARGAAR